jgi:PAS domain S-box-containing protein
MTSGRAIRLLLVGGEASGAELVRAAFPAAPVEWSVETDVDAWVNRACDLVLLRFGAHREGNGVLREALSRGIGAPVIMICDKPDPAMEADAIAIGASDVLLADQLSTPLLDRAARYALERSRAIAELRHSESRFRMLIEGSPDAIFVHSRGVLLYVNPAAVTMLGYDLRLELVARPVADIVHADSLATTWIEVRNLVERGVTAGARACRFVRRDGKIVQSEVVGIPVSLDDHPAVATVARDLTERNQMQARLLFSDRMASVGTLAAGVAHEINNPLAYITANLGFAAEELGRMATSAPLREIRQAIDEARDGAERVRVIVRDLKTFSRADEQESGLADVKRVLESAINMSFNEIRHRAQLVRQFADVPPVVANEGRLGQVFLNLLVNAAQAIPEGTAANHEIEVVLRSNENREIVVEVRDTGSGIPPEHIPRLFDPFFTTKPVGVGTGLGLAVCHGIVTGLGGEIEVQSEVGKGSVFRVRLPAAAPRSVEPPPIPAPAPTSARRARVLVLDDEPLVCSSIRRMLHREHDVTTATDAREVLLWLRRGDAFDVIFCDLMMPEMTGMDFHAELLRSHPQVAQSVVFFTGGAFTPRAKAFLDAVPNARLDKPPVPQNLRALIRERLQ